MGNIFGNGQQHEEQDGQQEVRRQQGEQRRQQEEQRRQQGEQRRQQEEQRRRQEEQRRQQEEQRRQEEMRRHEEEKVAALKKEVINLFNGQQLLLLGHYGVGKSSFINTVNHVLNLVQPNVPYQELAELSARESDHGTLIYRAYGPRKKMYMALKESDFSAKQDFGPIFFDVAGVNDKIVNEFDLKQFLIHLVNGQVKEYTDMVRIYNREDQMEQMRDESKVDNLRAWSIICLVSVADAFPTRLLQHVDQALKELKVQPGGGKSAIFAILILMYMQCSVHQFH